MKIMISIVSFLFLVFSVFYFSDKDKINTMSFELPELERVSTKHFNNGFFGLGPFDDNYVGRSLPEVSKAREVKVDKDDVGWKTKRTPYSYADDVKTMIPRLTKEEIEKAPVVDVIPMNYNGQDIDLVVVRVGGKTYDASDGVRVYIPKNYGKIFQENREKIRRGGR